MCEETNVCVIIGQNVKSIRIKKGISSKVFAQKLGISVSDLTKLEAGKICGFHCSDIHKISEILNADSAEILKNVAFVYD